MMVNEQTQHLTGADLVRFLDGEDSPDVRARHEAHLAACAACAGDLATLRDESRRVSRWLRRYDGAMAGGDGAAGSAVAAPQGRRSAAPPDGQSAAPPAAREPRSTAAKPSAAARPRGTALPPWLKAAAAILLVAVPAVAVPGVREWVVDVVGAGAGPVEPASEPEAAATAPAVEASRFVRFVPAPGPFTVRFDAPEPGSVLVLGREAGTSAADDAVAEQETRPTATARPGEAVLELEGAAEPVVSAGSIHVRNRPDDAGRYTLRLPAATTDVRVLVGGREVVVDGAGLDRGAVVPLGAQ